MLRVYIDRNWSRSCMQQITAELESHHFTLLNSTFFLLLFAQVTDLLANRCIKHCAPYELPWPYYDIMVRNSRDITC